MAESSSYTGGVLWDNSVSFSVNDLIKEIPAYFLDA